ncbi:MAG: hypothetical protein CVU88_04940 [Firmicutes bacterium HGW-Firmicutes-13]|nr:MAG: hypothetical protein CVU88_04940 [Firmicutes bacterium HGW-Firmicutes-13]
MPKKIKNIFELLFPFLFNYVIIELKMYFYQPNYLFKYNGSIYTVKGTHNKDARVILKETSKSISIKKLEPHRFNSGLVAFYERSHGAIPPRLN